MAEIHIIAETKKPIVKSFFDKGTSTITHVIYERTGSECAIVDSVMDFDPKSGRLTTQSADRVIDFVRNNSLKAQWLLETHAHADHISAAPYLREQLGGLIAVGEGIKKVQKVFKKVFNLEARFNADGEQFDYLFSEDEIFYIGNLRVKAMHVPGHTPADVAYAVEDAMIFVGDTLFMPDVGTARCDFPGGDAHILYQSVQKLFSLPPETRLFLCHDYPPEGREPIWETTVGEERQNNIQINETISEAKFVKRRLARDATLAMPALILPSIQINIQAGELPKAEGNGTQYLKIPINAF
jgi:glyoxylase-like metal-dependent hydrolase (beta-lactamase superfamily II)